MSQARTAAIYAGLGALTLVIVFPLLYALSGSFMSPQDLSTYPPSLLPSHPRLTNFESVFRIIPLGRQYFNSTFVALAVMFGQLATATLSAYAFAFLRMPYRNAVFGVFLATLFVPPEAVIIPNYLLFADHGLINTFFALILPFLATGFGTFLLRQFFLAFPKDLHEAALVDGCGHLRFLWLILVPLSRPALASLAIFTFITTWNQYLWPLLVTRTVEMQTLQIGISQLQNADFNEENVVLAGVVLALLPVLVLVFVAQRHIVRGLTAGAVRG